jgi:hypothetical protein
VLAAETYPIIVIGDVIASFAVLLVKAMPELPPVIETLLESVITILMVGATPDVPVTRTNAT